MARAKAWYSAAFGLSPYFDEPFCVGFDVGGVPNIEEAHAALVARGATPADPIADVGGDIKVATLKDSFGNVIGIIENPHFKGA